VIHGRARTGGEYPAGPKHTQQSADRSASIASAEDGMIQQAAALRATFIAGQGRWG
jgi:hypothetical protein